MTLNASEERDQMTSTRAKQLVNAMIGIIAVISPGTAVALQGQTSALTQALVVAGTLASLVIVTLRHLNLAKLPTAGSGGPGNAGQ